MSGAALKAETRRAALKEAVARLKALGLDTPVLDARLIVQHVLGIGWDTLFLGSDRKLLGAERLALDAALARREAREPVARIVGRRHFWTLDLAVSPATLDPRADSETVIEAALAAIPDRTRPMRLLDLGTGTGALLLALLKELPNAIGVGVDRSEDAARVAHANAAGHGLVARALMIVGDWGTALGGCFDLIVSNPPYIAAGDLPRLPPEVRLYDPIDALDGGTDGLDAYRRIVPALPALLAPDGAAVLEMGAGQGDRIAAIARENRLAEAARRADLGKVERALTLRHSPE